jgi:glycine oxidase
MNGSDICIAGAGIIGLSLALELHSRGASVIVLDSGDPMREASSAAAGMLAAEDPHNPRELASFSRHSVSLYPSFLDRIHALSGIDLPFQTQRTLQGLVDTVPALTSELQAELLLDRPIIPACDSSSGFAFLHEHSIDPRQLAPALIAAVAATRTRVLCNSPVLSTASTHNGVQVETTCASIEAAHFVDCTGAWANSHESDPPFKAIPVKGQMLALELPADLPLRTTVRTRDIYIVPRIFGPSAGRAIVGATVEHAGYDKSVHHPDIDLLRRQAIALLPGLAAARVVDSWAGLRPATSDHLPLIGAHPTRPHHWFATGHYRNGILLAPATAQATADMLLGRPNQVLMDAFSPMRLTPEFAQTLRYSRTP